MKDNAQRRLRDRTSARLRRLLEQGKKLKTERQFHVSFPKVEAHKGHHVGQVSPCLILYQFYFHFDIPLIIVGAIVISLCQFQIARGLEKGWEERMRYNVVIGGGGDCLLII